MNFGDQLVHTTVRIEFSAPGRNGSGTGFFMNFSEEESVRVPAIVTNKHVVAGAIEGRFFLTASKNGGEPDLGNLISVPVRDFEKCCILHPDPQVDIAVLPIAAAIQWLKKQGKSPFYNALAVDMIADGSFMSELTAIEDILMIGYPIGLWDSKHNFPIVRRGITATPIYADFNGQSQFVIDAACFPGSSGSPVFLYNHGSYQDKNGTIMLGVSRIMLLGILYGGPQHTTEGDIQVRPIPSSNRAVAISRIPSNLGYCIKAEKLRYFVEYFRAGVADAKQDVS